MPVPTAAQIREWSKVDFDALGFDTDEALARLVRLAVAQVTRWTGQFWNVETGVYSDLAPALGSEPLAEDLVQKFVEWEAFRKQEDRAETMADFDLLSSFSAGGYSETRRSGKDAMEAQVATLKALLWPVMSYEAQEAWIEMIGGPPAPALEITPTIVPTGAWLDGIYYEADPWGGT
jgi:hypothetical protein